MINKETEYIMVFRNCLKKTEDIISDFPCGAAPRLLIICLFVLIFAASAYPANRVVLTVGDVRFRELDVQKAIDAFIPRGGFHRNNPEVRKKYRGKAVKYLIEKALLYYRAREDGITVNEEAVNSVVKANIKVFGSREKFLKVLKKNEMNPDDFRLRIRINLMVRRLVNMLREKISLTDGELKAYYEKNLGKFRRPESRHIRHIFIKVEPDASGKEIKEKRRLAERLLKELKGGADFYDIAYKYSEGPYRVKGGDMGFIHRGRLAPELEKAAFGLKDGDLSPVIRSIYGFHIIWAGEKKKGGLVTFDGIKEKLKKELEEKRFQEAKEDIIAEMKKKIAVQVVN